MTNPPIPDELSAEVADFITKLLVKDPRKRLGGGEEDAEELKRHSFFKVSSPLSQVYCSLKMYSELCLVHGNMY
jgi:serine/threonine protein kinase